MMRRPVCALRAARLSDLAALVVLERHCFAGDAWPKSELREMLEKSLVASGTAFLLAVDGCDAVQGYGLGDRTKNGNGEIISLAVHQSARGCGLGRAFLDLICARLYGAGAEKISLTVDEKNSAAISLYQTAGFRRQRRLLRYYKDSDGIRMTRVKIKR